MPLDVGLMDPIVLHARTLLTIRLSKTEYHWLQAQLSLLKAECGNLVGEFSESDTNLQTSRQIASQFDFPSLPCGT